MTVPSGWFPVALAAGVEPGTSAGTRLGGAEIVVWRDAAGLSHVWEDRCPHRGMRLSFGFVRGGHIACLYHGWQFDAAGQCRFIPAHPKLEVPGTITVTRYASAERLGIVWAFVGTPAPDDAPPGQNLATTAVRSLTIAAPASTVRATLASERSIIEAERPIVMVETGALLRFPEDGLLVGLQPLSRDETCLHAVIADDAFENPLERRPRVSAWLETLRHRAEAAFVQDGRLQAASLKEAR